MADRVTLPADLGPQPGPEARLALLGSPQSDDRRASLPQEGGKGFEPSNRRIEGGRLGRDPLIGDQMVPRHVPL